MRIDYLSPDILLFRGDSLAALATAFIDDKRVLLVDALASEYDAIEMRDYLERDLRLHVASILLTRTGKPYEAGLHVFPAAQIAVASASAPALQWGRHQLAFMQTPGDPARALALEAVHDRLLFVRERVAGAVAVIGESSPEQADEALAWLERRAAARIIPASIAAQEACALTTARAYLAKLAVQVRQVRATGSADADVARAIARIALDDCLPDGVHTGPLERHWHADNLARIAARGLFPTAVAPRVQRQAGGKVGRFLRNNAVAATLMCMLGRLGRSGV